MIGFLKGWDFMGGNVGFLLTIDLIFINLLYEKWDGYYCCGFFGCV